MKTFDRTIRLSAALAIAMAVFLTGLSARTEAYPASKILAFSNVEKHVHIKVEIHGDIDHHTVESVEHLVAEWLEAAHFVVEHTAGANALELHVVLNVTDNHHFTIHEDCGDWHEEKEAAVLDAIDDILHHMTEDFIEKFSH